jgi:hypothetical protein
VPEATRWHVASVCSHVGGSCSWPRCDQPGEAAMAWRSTHALEHGFGHVDALAGELRPAGLHAGVRRRCRAGRRAGRQAAGTASGSRLREGRSRTGRRVAAGQQRLLLALQLAAALAALARSGTGRRTAPSAGGAIIASTTTSSATAPQESNALDLMVRGPAEGEEYSWEERRWEALLFVREFAIAQGGWAAMM